MRSDAADRIVAVGHLGPDPAAPGNAGDQALAALAALGQPTRLEIFRRLVREEPAGLAAGAIAEAVGGPHNTISTHLAILARAGLVRARRDGRSIVYRAELAGMHRLVTYLLTDCCDGRPEACAPVSAALSAAGCDCAPTATREKDDAHD